MHRRAILGLRYRLNRNSPSRVRLGPRMHPYAVGLTKKRPDPMHTQDAASRGSSRSGDSIPRWEEREL
jgi:hypothetical protein